MSWQRILEVARRRGMPIVVTDIAGREPMVLLPFEQYEQLLEKDSSIFQRRETETLPDLQIPSVEGTLREEPVLSGVDAGQPIIQKAKKSTISAVERGQDTNVDESLNMEERFYLEPIEETQK